MRNKRVTAVLALFLGIFGIHRFYLGQYLSALLYLIYPIAVLTVLFNLTGSLEIVRDQVSLSFGTDTLLLLLMFLIIPIFDFIWFLAMSSEKFDQRYNKKEQQTGRAIILSILVFIVGASFNYFTYQQYYVTPTINVSGGEADISLTSENLANTFTSNTDSAVTAFSNQVLEVTGEVVAEETQLAKDGDNRVLILQGNNDFTIRCEFKPKEQEEVKKVKVGEAITVRGSYREVMVFDIILENCILAEKK